MYTGNSKCDSRFGDETTNMVKFMKLEETSLYKRQNILIYRRSKLNNLQRGFLQNRLAK